MKASVEERGNDCYVINLQAENLSEEKLLKDFEAISNYVGKEIWELEKSERSMSS